MASLKFYKARTPKKFPHTGERMTHDFGIAGSVYPIRTNKLLIDTGNIYKSESKGETFELMGSTKGNSVIHYMDSGNVIAQNYHPSFSTKNQIEVWRSDDEGKNFLQVGSTITLGGPDEFDRPDSYPIQDKVYTLVNREDHSGNPRLRYVQVYENDQLFDEFDVGTDVYTNVWFDGVFDPLDQAVYFVREVTGEFNKSTGEHPVFRLDQSGLNQISTTPAHPLDARRTATGSNGYAGLGFHKKTGLLTYRTNSHSFRSLDSGKTWEEQETNVFRDILAEDFIRPKGRIIYSNFGTGAQLESQRVEGPVFDGNPHFADYEDFVLNTFGNTIMLSGSATGYKRHGMAANRNNRRISDVVRWETS